MKKKKNIFVICSVRIADEEYRKNLEAYVSKLEAEGHIVHLPHRDTNQNATGLEICKQNAVAIFKADEVHIFYNSKSQGTHFDMGVAFALNKPLIVVENEEYGEGKSFPRMIDEWEKTLKI
ncbi:MAG: nucleoside 2-deoxyribosyltransferase [bacterium]